MAIHKAAAGWELEQDVERRMLSLLKQARWILRITEYRDRPAPVLVVKERISPHAEQGNSAGRPVRAVLRERGLLYGQPLRRCLPVVREILSRVRDEAGIPLELDRFVPNGRIVFRGNLPLDDEAGELMSRGVENRLVGSRPLLRGNHLLPIHELHAIGDFC
jgi:hypothetical protein